MRLLFLAVMGLVFVSCDGTEPPGLRPFSSGPAGSTVYKPKGIKGSDTTDPQELAEDLCQRYASCTSLSAGALAECEASLPRLVALIPDVRAFLKCFEALSCEQLLHGQEPATLIIGCMDLDEQSARCTDGGNGLHYCTNAGVCRDVSCSDICELQGKEGGGCYSGSYGQPTCICG